MSLNFLPSTDKATRERTSYCIEHIGSWNELDRNGKDEFLARIEAGIDLQFSGRDDKRTLLHLAARNGNDEVVSILLAKGAPVNSRDTGGATPLNLACEEGAPKKKTKQYIKTIETLLSCGADVNARNGLGYTPLYWPTLIHENEIITNLLLKHGANIYFATRNLPAIPHSMAHMGRQYDEFHGQHVPPKTADDVYNLFCVWPVANPDMPINQEQQIRQIFSYAHWKDRDQITAVLDGLRERGISAELCDILQDNTEVHVAGKANKAQQRKAHR